ncbi:MAG: aminotransferase class III-fold pyridoxal phosphate-dependent enzyme, partial [Nocardioides sp.]|uniref:aminotransferase class III-fold pyridoxal phosphate-dependent enzyme n=1 Tax=Nocardioides sp. TaxID=35761 RepID=UPI003F017601
IGRTGAWFAHQHPDLVDTVVVPDVVTLAKGLGGGIPIGATIATGPAAALLEPGNHGTTFGGNPVAAAAALAVLDTIENDGLLAHTEAVGSVLRAGLAADPRVTEVRGAGLLIGLDLAPGISSARVLAAALEAGWIINAPTPERIRLAPPLVLSHEDAEAFVAAWPGILDAASDQADGGAA